MTSKDLVDAVLFRGAIRKLARYVREYSGRGADHASDACDRCELSVGISPLRSLRPLYVFSSGSAQRQLVTWLCAGSRCVVRATREPLTLT